MNKTQLEHAVIALLIQCALWPFVGVWIAGALACALFMGRELAQNEYRLANRRGWLWGDTLPVRWHEGLWRGWTLDSVLDITAPMIACLLLASAASWAII